jgi:glutamyl-tRNA synthetase
MHVGNLRSALYAFLFARQNKGDFILRIEDTDLERYVEGAVDVIYNTLKTAGITFDEGPNEGGNFGPYVQSERKDIYNEYALKLIPSKSAYYCFCDKKRLDSLGNENRIKKYDKHCLHLTEQEVETNLKNNIPYVIRQNMPTEGHTEFVDLVFGNVKIENKELEDHVLIKSDGMPTYNFANVIDDHFMGITHVIRGNEYLSSTPKYNLLYKAFGWQTPQYMHLTPIMYDATRKLSKRFGDANFDDFLEKGYLPEAIVNYIALLGWSPKDNQEKFSMEELIEKFSVTGLSKSSSIFDENKMKWLNGEYIKELDFETFMDKANPYFEKSAIKGKYDYRKLGVLIQSRIEIFSQIPEKVDFLAEFNQFDNELYYNKKLKIDENIAKDIIVSSIEKLNDLKIWNEDNLHNVVKEVAEILTYKTGQVYTVLRVALTGVTVTPGGSVEMADILGRDESLRRLKLSKEWLA